MVAVSLLHFFVANCFIDNARAFFTMECIRDRWRLSNLYIVCVAAVAVSSAVASDCWLNVCARVVKLNKRSVQPETQTFYDR